MQRYVDACSENPTLSAKEIIRIFEDQKQPELNESNDTVAKCADSVELFAEAVIKREQVKEGNNFECYRQMLAKCHKVIPNFGKLTFDQIDYNKCVEIAQCFAKSKGYKGYTRNFRALLGKASKDKKVNFDIAQIGDFRFGDYNPDINKIKDHRPDVLTAEQVAAFINTDPMIMTGKYKKTEHVELFHDFCIFMFNSFLAPIDAMLVRYEDITNRGTIRIKRKKTHRTIEFPITPAMEGIIKKHRGQSTEGYIFPIVTFRADKRYAVRDYKFKRFGLLLNYWLKYVGKYLGTSFSLYAYVFRHTAITVALDHSLPISYVVVP